MMRASRRRRSAESGVGHGGGQDLERDLAVELAVAGGVDDPHAPAVQLPAQLVARAREVGPVHDALEVSDRAVGEGRHGGSDAQERRAPPRGTRPRWP